MGTITTELVETGEKRDARGRRRTPAQRRSDLVREFAATGLTMAAFARRENVKYATFAGWVSKAQQSTGGKNAIKFTEVRVPPVMASKEAPLEIRLPDGTVVRGGKVAELVALLRALRP